MYGSLSSASRGLDGEGIQLIIPDRRPVPCVSAAPVASNPMSHVKRVLDGGEAEVGVGFESDAPMKWPCFFSLASSVPLPENDEALQLHCQAPGCTVVRCRWIVKSIQEDPCHIFMAPLTWAKQARLPVSNIQAAECWQVTR